MPSSPRFLRALALVAAAAVAAPGCSGAAFEDRTAVVEIDGTSETYEVASCGLDDRTVFVVGRGSSGAVIQLVMGVEEDRETAVAVSTGLTIDVDGSASSARLAAFGAEAWERRGSTGPPPGTIDSARLRGSRIQVSGAVVPVDVGDVPIPDAGPRPVSIDARCDLEGS